MRFCIILVWFIFICFPKADLNAQDSLIVISLENALHTLTNDTLRVDTLNELAFLLSVSKPQKATEYAQNALLRANMMNYTTGQANAFMRFGTIYTYKGNYEMADSFFLLALPIRKRLSNKLDIAGTYNNLGLIKSYQGMDLKAIEHYKNGLQFLEALPPSKKEAMLYNNIAESYMYLDSLEQAIDYLNQSIKIRDDLGDQLGKAHSLLNLAIWYTKINNHKKAIETYNNSLIVFTREKHINGMAKNHIGLGESFYAQGQFHKAESHFEMALKLKEHLEATDIALLYQFRGKILKSKHQLTEALESFDLSLNTFAPNGNVANSASVKFYIGQIHHRLANYNLALKFLSECQTIADTLQNQTLNMEACEELAEVYAKSDQTDLAFFYSKKASELKDNINSDLQAGMNFKINYEEEKVKTAELQKQQIEQQAASKRKTIIIISLVIVIFLWILLFIAILKSYKDRQKRKEAELETSTATLKSYKDRQKRKAAELETAAANNKIDTLLKEQELKTSYAKLEGQDEERKRIGQDLHDRVGGILSTIKLYLKGFDEKLDALASQNQQQQFTVNDLLDKAVTEVRKIAKNIHSGTLTKFGLKAELETLSDMLKNSGHIEVKVITHGFEKRLPVAMEIKVYRIIQELISNVLKHAQASKITVQVNEFKDILNVLVEDDGKGFDPDLVKKSNGMGLKNVESRVYDLHGTIIIDSGKGNGTSVAIDIPIEN